MSSALPLYRPFTPRLAYLYSPPYGLSHSSIQCMTIQSITGGRSRLSLSAQYLGISSASSAETQERHGLIPLHRTRLRTSHPLLRDTGKRSGLRAPQPALVPNPVSKTTEHLSHPTCIFSSSCPSTGTWAPTTSFGSWRKGGVWLHLGIILAFSLLSTSIHRGFPESALLEEPRPFTTGFAGGRTGDCRLVEAERHGGLGILVLCLLDVR